MNRLQKHYINIVRVDFLFKDHYINVMELPQIHQISLNTGIGLKAILDKKQILTALLSMELVSGQRPMITRAKKSIDKFKLREKMPIGCKVTLRKHNLYEFLDRFINIILPCLDNSNDIFNSLYFKQYSSKQKQDNFIYVNLNQVNDVFTKSNNLSLEKFFFNSTNLNVSNDLVRKPYLKWTSSFYSFCIQNFRSKIWLDNWNKKLFIPKSIYFQFLFNPISLNSVENSFLLHHNFTIFSTLSSGNTKYLKKNIFKSQPSNNFNYFSISFGFKDFLSSTAFGTVFNNGQLDLSYGLDITFNVKYLNNKHLISPTYFFSSFQMPF